MRVDVRNLSVSYGNHVALSDVSLDVSRGELLVVVGPNGSGKSSFLKALAGISGHRGIITFDGGPRPRRGVGFMPQDVSSRIALTVLETVLLGRFHYLGLRVTPRDLAATRDILMAMGIESLADRTLAELSGGQRQLVFLAQALAGEPSVLLLDEPISALDIRHQLQVMDVVSSLTRSLDLATVVVLHDLVAAARYADRIALFSDSRLAALGAPREVLTAERLEDVFGVETCCLTDRKGRLIVVPVAATSSSNAL